MDDRAPHPAEVPASPGQNHLLAALPTAEFERLAPHLDSVHLPLGKALSESGVQMEHVYFPTTAIVSLSYILESGMSSEVAAIGNEGFVGIPLLLGGDTTPTRAVILSAGHGYRMEPAVLKSEFDRPGDLQRLLLLYTQALFTQLAQIGICNHNHSVEQKLCRWLLSTLDRLPSSEMQVTQEQVANTLGVRREGITEAAGNLKRAGFIEYRRGHISVLDRKGLERRTCECYAVMKGETDRLLPKLRVRPERLATG